MLTQFKESTHSPIDCRSFVKKALGGFAGAAFSANELNAAIYKRD